MNFTLPFPPASLSGHNKGHWRDTRRIVATYRAEAFHIARSARLAERYTAPDDGDICITFTFYPPDNRGDRTNYPGRMKAQIDGIAEALSINDRRFLPRYEFGDVAKPGRVEVKL